MIGGSTVASRNVISGNLNRGLNFFTSSGTADNNLVQNNYIGVDATGTRPWATRPRGSSATTSRTRPSSSNVISANGSSGIWFRTSTGDG